MTAHMQAESTTSPQSTKSRFSAGAIGLFTGLGLLAAFIVQNREPVGLDLLVWTFEWPLWLLTVVSAVLGALVWFGAGVMRRHRRRVDRRDG
jgi:uncharacterized integral membrane protein